MDANVRKCIVCERDILDEPKEFFIECNGIKIPFQDRSITCLECAKKGWETQLADSNAKDLISLKDGAIQVDWKLFCKQCNSWRENVWSYALYAIGIFSAHPLGNWEIYLSDRKFTYPYIGCFTRKEDAIAFSLAFFRTENWEIRRVSEVVSAKEVLPTI